MDKVITPPPPPQKKKKKKKKKPGVITPPCFNFNDVFSVPGGDFGMDE